MKDKELIVGGRGTSLGTQTRRFSLQEFFDSITMPIRIQRKHIRNSLPIYEKSSLQAHFSTLGRFLSGAKIDSCYQFDFIKEYRI